MSENIVDREKTSNEKKKNRLPAMEKKLVAGRPFRILLLLVRQPNARRSVPLASDPRVIPREKKNKQNRLVLYAGMGVYREVNICIYNNKHYKYSLPVRLCGKKRELSDVRETENIIRGKCFRIRRSQTSIPCLSTQQFLFFRVHLSITGGRGKEKNISFVT